MYRNASVLVKQYMVRERLKVAVIISAERILAVDVDTSWQISQVFFFLFVCLVVFFFQ